MIFQESNIQKPQDGIKYGISVWLRNYYIFRVLPVQNKNEICHAEEYISKLALSHFYRISDLIQEAISNFSHYKMVF